MAPADDMGLADDMVEECRAQGQSARTVPGAADRDRLRAQLREAARSAGMRIRTAERDGVVLLVRLDAALWQEKAATMRAKLTPPAGPTGDGEQHQPSSISLGGSPAGTGGDVPAAGQPPA